MVLYCRCGVAVVAKDEFNEVYTRILGGVVSDILGGGSSDLDAEFESG